MAVVRNFDGVQFEVLRKQIDPVFNALHDELETCYYDYWKKGLSAPWLVVFDVRPTPEESKAQFGLLHGAIFWARDLIFHFINKREGLYSEDSYRFVRDEGNQIVKDKVQVARDLLGIRLTAGQLQTIRAEIESRLGESFDWSAQL